MSPNCLLVLTVAVLLVRGGFSQCYTDTECTGTIIQAADEADCCVATNDGLAFFNGGVCNQCIVHGFESPVYEVNEGGEIGTEVLMVMFRTNVKGNTLNSVTAQTALMGTLRAAPDGTATSSDFVIPLPVEVSGGSATLSLFTNNDQITLEYDDRIFLSFNPNLQFSDAIDQVTSAGEYIRSSATVNIIDDDDLDINFEDSIYSIEEGENLTSPIRLRYRNNQNSFNITLKAVDILTAEGKGLGNFINSMAINDQSRATAGDPGGDFSDSVVQLTIPAANDPTGGPQTYLIDQFFRVVDDDVDEILQVFAVVAEIGPDVPDGISCFQTIDDPNCNGRLGAIRINIVDNDRMLIGFSRRFIIVSECDAAPGEDLFFVDLNVHSQRTSEQQYFPMFRLANSNATVVGLTSTNPDFDVIFGSIIGSGDSLQFTAILDTLSRVLSVPLMPQIRNDFRPEGRECFTVNILRPDRTEDRDIFSCFSDDANMDDFFCATTICIDDDDEPFVVAFVETTYTVLENVNSVEVCVNLTRPEIDILDETVDTTVIDTSSSVYIPPGAPLATHDAPDLSTIPFLTYPMTEGTDFQQRTSIFDLFNAITTINATVRVVCYNQIIYDDQCLEPDEYLGLTLGVRMASAVTLVEPMYNQTSILILDDDVAVVGLEETFHVVSEGDMVEVCAIVYSPPNISCSCPIQFPFSVNLSTADGSAVSPMDYGALSTILTFDTCETRVCAMISIMNDAIPEGTESFTVTLEDTPGLDDRITLDPVDGEIQISDGDVAVVGLERTLYQVSEGVGYVLVCAVVIRPDENTDCPIGFAFDVELSTTDGTAVQIMDYDSLDMTLQFAECKRMSCKNITINEDETLENIESFFVTLERNGLDSSITLNPTRAEIEIRDNDGPGVVGLEQTFYQTAEGVGTVEVCAVVYSPNGNLACPIDFAFSVELLTRDGVAVFTMDYGSITTTVPFGRCDTRSCVDVSITDDEVLENPESFSVSLQRNGLDSRITLEPTEAEIEIIDNDDAAIGLERTLYSIREGSAPAVQVCIIVYEPTGICPIAFPFSVMFSTSDLTAEVNKDYLDADTTQNFEACDTRRCISVPIVDDSVGEPDEQLSISLGDPSDSRIIASLREGLINIIDRDMRVISIIGGVSLTLDSDLNGPTPQFTLTCISTGGPATTVTWTRDSTTVTQGTQTVLNDPVTAQYTHTLTVTGRLPGLYKCTVANNKPSLASANFIVPAEPDSVAFEPVNGTAVRISLNVNSNFSTTLRHVSISNLTGAVMSESSLVLPAHTTVVLEEDVGLDDGIDEYEHIFTLYQIIFHGVRGFETTETFTFDKKAFQVQFGPIGYCVDWGVKKALHIEEQLQSQLIRIIRKRTNSSNGILTTPFLRKGLFLCHGNPTKITYRTTLVNPFHTTSSTHLVGIIQSWVSTAPSLILDGLLVRVSPSCPTSISSLDEEECETGTSYDRGLGDRITQTLNFCAVRNLGEEICSLGGCPLSSG